MVDGRDSMVETAGTAGDTDADVDVEVPMMVAVIVFTVSGRADATPWQTLKTLRSL